MAKNPKVEKYAFKNTLTKIDFQKPSLAENCKALILQIVSKNTIRKLHFLKINLKKNTFRKGWC